MQETDLVIREKFLEFLAWRLTGVAPVEVREASATTEAALLGADFARDERLEAEEREDDFALSSIS